MIPISGLIAATAAFASEAAAADPDAPVQSDIWATAGRIIDHLGNVQAWATEIVRSGASVDRELFKRPSDRDRIEWFTEISAALIDNLAAVDPERECWTILGARPVASFWGRRMTNEAAKHLWDLRTAVDEAPLMPAELSLVLQADVIDEFADVFVPPARVRGIAPLPREVLLIADDLDRGWSFSRDWYVSDVSDVDAEAVDADVLRANVGDLVLFAWGRASPRDFPARFRIEGGDGALRAFARTPVHL